MEALISSSTINITDERSTMKTPPENKPRSQAYDFLSIYTSHSKRELEKIFSEDSDFQVASICKYIIEAGGKRLRPLLTLLACEAVSGDHRKALPVSVAIELAHTLAIIQDDIFDGATMRRGVKAVHVAWGTPNAILASDYLLLKMVDSILKMANSDVNSQELTLKVLNIVVEAGLEAVEGEYLDLQLSEKEEATIEECITVAEKKTGAFIKAALEAGALVGGGTQEEIDVLKRYGKELGVAFQIVDDMLGLVGSPDLVGKDIGADVANKRMTVVTAHALQNSSRQHRRRIFEVLKDRKLQQTDLVENLGRIFRETDSIVFAQKLASEYAEKAVSDLRRLRPSKAKMILEAVPTIVVNRKS